LLWVTWLTANTVMWMNDVAAAWLMTSLTSTPLWVALVQAASTLPVFLLALPSGALADIVDRRRYFMVTQFWVAGIAILTCIIVLAGWMTAPLLLGLTFANGIGLAMRWPVFAALLPEVMPRPLLPQGLALNGIAMNGSRIIGPLLAGAIIGAAGSAWVFVLNALLSVAVGFAIMSWHRVHKESPLGRERLPTAMRVGIQYVSESGRLRGILLRIALFFFHSTALLALLPLVARGMPGGDAGDFTVLLSAMGAGAICAALVMPRLRAALSAERMVVAGTLGQAGAAAAAAYAPHLMMAVPAMFVAGIAWISAANSLTVAAQMTLPDWVRARGMSIYQMAVMGAAALGAAIWGQVATASTVQEALVVAAISSVSLALLVHYALPLPEHSGDLTPAPFGRLPEVNARPGRGRVLTRVEYRIDPAQAEAFLALMEDSRRSRIQQGALEWSLLHDVAEPDLYVEQIVDESWTEHLRRFDRFTASDAQVREMRQAMHAGDKPPRVTRYIIEKT
jgi:MFS family permease